MLDRKTTENTDNCDCEYCRNYGDLISKIRHHTKKKWLTISPPSPSAGSAQEHFDDWLKSFMMFRKFAEHLLGVAEFENGRLHFHIMYTVKDAVKEYKVLNKWRIHSMLRVYKGLPREGAHYLFKDIETALELLFDPIFTIDILFSEFKALQLLKLTNKIDQISKPETYPSWMCHSNK